MRRPQALRAWLAAYAAATATDAAHTKILDAATAGVTDKPSRATVDNYREHLGRIFVLDPVPAWVPTFNESVSDKDVRHLNWLHAQIGDRLADRVIVTTGEHAYRRSDGVAVVPLALLGP